MPTTDRPRQLREVADLLKTLTAELELAQNPNRIGMQLLQADAMGCVKAPYHADAFKVWADALKRNADDLEARHHLAIMHHARAFDHERTAPAEANRDWQQALEHWHALWTRDAFWQAVADRAFKADKPPAREAAARKLRDDLPARLLQVHFDIATDPATLRDRFPRARWHLTAALESAFPADTIAGVRKAAYERFVRDVPDEVWSPQTSDPTKIQLGVDRIHAYLKLDPGCPPALIDMLGLQVRLLYSWYSELQAAGGDETRRQTILVRLRQAARDWRPYFDTLISHAVDMAADGADDLRQKLCFWYRVMGDVYAALAELGEAISLLRQGLVCGTSADSNLRLCKQTLADVLTEAAVKKFNDAPYSGRRAARDAARVMLDEALQLDPDNAEIARHSRDLNNVYIP